MNIFSSIRFSSSGPACRDCAYFQNDPAFIENSYRGLTVMSSGFASVRDRDGICNYHQIYLSARDSCPCFSSIVREITQEQAR